MILALAFVIGAVTGLRSMTAPAAVSWAARLGHLKLGGTWLAFLGYSLTPYVFTLFALGELVVDKLPRTPSRTSPGPFGARIVVGAMCGAALAITGGQAAFAGAIAGAVGAVAGTLGGYQARTRAVKALDVPDFVIALAEDAVAVGTAAFVVSRF